MSSRRALTVPPLEIGGGVEPFAGTTTGQVGLRIEDVLQGLQQIGEVLCGYTSRGFLLIRKIQSSI